MSTSSSSFFVNNCEACSSRFSIQTNAFRRNGRNAIAYCDCLRPPRLTVAARGGRKRCSQILQGHPKQQFQAVPPVAGPSWPCECAHSIQSKRPCLCCVRRLLNSVSVEMQFIASQPLPHSMTYTYLLGKHSISTPGYVTPVLSSFRLVTCVIVPILGLFSVCDIRQHPRVHHARSRIPLIVFRALVYHMQLCMRTVLRHHYGWFELQC